MSLRALAWSVSLVVAFAACETPPAEAPVRQEEIDDTPVPAVADVVLNEIACSSGDWIELGNREDHAVDLTGWRLTDGDSDDDDAYVLPSDSIVGPGGVLVIERQTEDADGLLFGIDCEADEIRLVAPTWQVVDRRMAGPLREGQSASRLPHLTGEFGVGFLTPRAPNQAWFDESAQLFNADQVIDVAITLDEPALAALSSSPYTYVEGTIEVSGGGVPATGTLDVGVRLKGVYGSFRPLPQKAAFRVDFDRFVDDQRLFGLEHIVLNNMVQDPSQVHEQLAYALFSAMDVPAPRARYARVSVNGEPYGLYLLLEAWDRDSLARHYPTTQHLYEGEYGADLFAQLEVDVGDEDETSDLTPLRAAMGVPMEQGYQALQAVADMAELQRMWATELYLGHWDGYPTVNNYFLHSDDDGFFTMMPWGTDQTFEARMGLFDSYGALFQRCLTLTECLLDYLDVVLDVADVAEALALDAGVDDFASTIAADIEADPKREFPSDYAFERQSATRDFALTRPAEARAFVETLLGDADEDGAPAWNDCNDQDPAFHPGALDSCDDGLDQDCDRYPDNGPDCPQCNERFAFSGSRYWVCREPRSYADALALCEEQGARLMSLDSPEEESAVWSFVPGGMWAGFSDTAEEGTFVNVDGEEASYLPWSPGEPNNCCGGENCAEVWGPGQWNDANCAEARTTICELPCQPGDLDEDGDGALAATVCGTDCDDTDPTRYPDAVDLCDDGIDQNCNGVADDGCPLACTLVERAGHDYGFCPYWMPAWDAASLCAARGMSLLRGSDESELDFVRNVAGRYGVDGGWTWIDVGDDAQEGSYVDSSGAPITSFFWAANEPNDPGGFEDCVMNTWDGWIDIPCNAGATVVCEAPCSGADLDDDGANDCGADCDDLDPAFSPTALELCDDGLDQNCNGLVDEDCPQPPLECASFDVGGAGYAACLEPGFFFNQVDRCTALGMTPWRPDDEQEQADVIGALAQYGLYLIWIDATDENHEGTWLHADGSPITYLPWGQGEPTDPASVEDCGAIFLDGGSWVDTSCGDAYPMVCEAP